MPKELVLAHHHLDKAVDAAYGKTKFAGEAERVSYPFELYEKITSPLALTASPRKKRLSRGEK
jgi:hypothetical protein